MKEPFRTKISIFKDLYKSKDTPFTLDIKDVYLRIKKGNAPLIDKIEKIRSKDITKAEKDKIKASLMAIMFNGTFKSRNDNGLDEHSGFCVLDFDDFPDYETMIENRDLITQKPYIYMCFISPSGNGLKAIARIPKSDKLQHIRRFNAIEKDFDNKYFDNKNKNVSRVCFESYDPNVYLNVYCEEFKEIAEDKGFSYVERVPICILKDEQRVIDIIMSWNWNKDFVDGQRNNFIFDIAGAFCEHGVDQSNAEGYILNNIVIGDFSEREALTAIKSAYRKRSFGIKYFEDYQSVKRIKSKLIQGENPKDIIKSLNVDKEAVKQVQEEIKENDDIFWDVKILKSGEEKITVEPFKYAHFLMKNGFKKYYPETAEKPTFVRVVENKVNLSSTEKIKDFVLNHLIAVGEINVWNYCSKSPYLFTEAHLNMIDSIHLEMLSDTKDFTFLPFLNGVVKVSKQGTDLIGYIDVDGYIWEDQIITRNFKEVEDYKNDFEDFIEKVSNNDIERTKALRSTIGYLIHTHKDKTDQKAIIFNDEEINENPNGGSGKSLMLTALNYIRKVVKIDGKSFDPNKSDFVYQRINLDTQIVSFDDVKRNFNFEQLFSLITEGIAVNRKNKDEIFIPFERSPKIVITTNYVINGTGHSHERRRHEIEFFQYFNNKVSPLDVYGRLLFDSWDDEDWNKFDNYMVSNIQLFLKKGLIQSKSINAEAKRFIQSTHISFYDWVDDEPIQTNVRIYNAEIMAKFTTDNKMFKDIPPRRLIAWINSYANFKGYELVKERDHNGRYFQLVTEEKTKYTDELPF